MSWYGHSVYWMISCQVYWFEAWQYGNSTGNKYWPSNCGQYYASTNYRSTGALLTEYLHSTDGVLAQYWRSTCTVLAEYLHSTGGVLAQYWRSTCTVLAEYLHSTSGALAQYWRSTGKLLVEYLHSAGGVLPQHWRSTGTVLEENLHSAGTQYCTGAVLAPSTATELHLLMLLYIFVINIFVLKFFL